MTLVRLDVERSSLWFHGGGEALHRSHLARALEAHGITTRRATLLDEAALSGIDCCHVWNTQDPREALAAVRWLVGRGHRVVLTPLHADLSAAAAGDRIAGAFLRAPRARYPALAEKLEHGALEAEVDAKIDGDAAHERWRVLRHEALALADKVLCLSHRERERLIAEHAVPGAKLAVTPVGASWPSATRAERDPGARGDATRADAAQGDVTRGDVAQGDYVLVPATRIEPLKNQLVALLALRAFPARVVVTGEAWHPRYTELCRELAAPNVEFVGLVPRERLLPMLRAARVVLHPSHMECASLTALDAALAGANLVTSDHGSEREYLGAAARYIDPCSPRDILARVCEAWEDAGHGARRAAQTARAASFTWERAAATTADAIATILRRPAGVGAGASVLTSGTGFAV